MKFKIDENLPVDVRKLLQQAQHEAATIADEGLSGAQDREILRVWKEEQRSLVTLDMDFANVTAYPPQECAGLVVLRLRRQDTRSVLDALQRALPLMEEDRLKQRLWIVEEDRVRIRAGE